MLIDAYQDDAVSTAIYPETARVFYPALGLAGEVGEVCNKIKKVIRDDNSVLSEEKRQIIGGELQDVMWYVAALARDLGFRLSELAQANLDKLADRAERGVLQGSGDNR